MLHVHLSACPYRVAQCVLSPRDTAVCVWTHQRGKGPEVPNAFHASLVAQSCQHYVCVFGIFHPLFLMLDLKQTSMTTQLFSCLKFYCQNCLSKCIKMLNVKGDSENSTRATHWDVTAVMLNIFRKRDKPSETIKKPAVVYFYEHMWNVMAVVPSTCLLLAWC